MFAMRAFARALACASIVALAASAAAQPVPGTGCPGVGPPLVIPFPPVPGATVTVRCPPASAAATCRCVAGAPSVVFIGNCITPPIPILPPLGCAPGPCFLACNPFASVPGPGVTFVAPAPPIGLILCVQCACVSFNAAGMPCVCFSDKFNIPV